MHGWMSGWDWAWMSISMGVWILLIGAVVYGAVRLGQRAAEPRR